MSTGRAGRRSSSAATAAPCPPIPVARRTSPTAACCRDHVGEHRLGDLRPEPERVLAPRPRNGTTIRTIGESLSRPTV